MAESSLTDQLQASGLDSKTAAAIRNEIHSAIEAAFRAQTDALPFKLQGVENWQTTSDTRINWIMVGITFTATVLVLGFIYWQIAGLSELMQTEFALIREEIAKFRMKISRLHEDVGVLGGKLQRWESE